MARFDLSDPQQLRACFALENLRPEIAAHNYAEGSRIRGGREAVSSPAEHNNSSNTSSGSRQHDRPEAVQHGSKKGSSGGRDSSGSTDSALPGNKSAWTEAEEKLLFRRHAMFEAGLLGRKKDGSHAVDARWKRVKGTHKGSSSSDGAIGDLGEDFFPGRTTGALREKWKEIDRILTGAKLSEQKQKQRPRLLQLQQDAEAAAEAAATAEAAAIAAASLGNAAAATTGSRCMPGSCNTGVAQQQAGSGAAVAAGAAKADALAATKARP